jgi:hypothetical protein
MRRRDFIIGSLAAVGGVYALGTLREVHTDVHTRGREIDISAPPYNAVGDDGVTDNSAALLAVCADVRDYDTIYVPKGIFGAKTPDAGLPISSIATPKTGVVVRGEGRDSVLKRLNRDGDTVMRNKILRIEGGTDIEIRNLTLDNNGCKLGGGVQVDFTNGFRMHHSYAIDSAFKPTGLDHYWLIVSNSSEVAVHHNRAARATAEFSNNCRAYLFGYNLLKRPANVGLWVTVQSDEDRYQEDGDIIYNLIVDPAYHGISITQDTGSKSPSNATFRRIRVYRNKIVRRTTPSNGLGMRVGCFTGEVGTNNNWDEIEIVRNLFSTESGLPRTKPELHLNHTEAAAVLDHMSIERNIVKTVSGLAGPAFVLSHLKNSAVENNRLYGKDGALLPLILSPPSENLQVHGNTAAIKRNT